MFIFTRNAKPCRPELTDEAAYLPGFCAPRPINKASGKKKKSAEAPTGAPKAGDAD